MAQLHALQSANVGRVTVWLLYQAEAHAANEWPVGKKVSSIEQHTCMQDRLEAAQAFVEAHNVALPVLVDSMSDEFQQVWGSWPFRFYGIKDGVLHLKSQPDPETHYYRMEDLITWVGSV